MKKIPISQIDALFANGSYPIEFLIYYRNPIDIDNIKTALKYLSTPFWPLFGEYRDGSIYAKTYSETDVISEATIDTDFSADRQCFAEIGNSVELANGKLFHLRILRYNNGTVLIPKMNHLAGDGYSYFYFLYQLAVMSRTHALPLKKQFIRAVLAPRHNRTVLRDFQFDPFEIPVEKQPDNLVIKFKHIAKSAVRDQIKTIAADQNARVSSNDILAATVVKTSVELQSNSFGTTINLTIPMDVRNHIKPYGTKYFGNGLMFHKVSFATGDLQQATIDDIAVRIRKSMPDISQNQYLEYLMQLETWIANKQFADLKPYDPSTGCLVTNISKLPTNKLDFGSGNPDAVIPITVGKNSVAIMADQNDYVLRLVY